MQPTVNLIQDVATPHNNVLIRALIQEGHIKVNTWYAFGENKGLYPWSKNITNECVQSKIYGIRPNVRFLWHCLWRSQEHYVIVGWANINTRLLIFLFFVFRRKFGYWTDYPNEKNRQPSIRNKVCRWLPYAILKHSKSTIFAVGDSTVQFFARRGFPCQRVVNLPIFVDSQEDIEAHRCRRADLFRPYSIAPGDFVVSAGSRLIKEKGYDLLITAISQLDHAIKGRIKVLLVGSGVCSQELQSQIRDLKLEQQIFMIEWMSIDDFKSLIACSDVFVHPARFDAYGGTTLGMALGVPVIGSTGAGAAIDRIKQGENGFLYEAEDTPRLACYIELLFKDRALRDRLAVGALNTAQSWSPARGVAILAAGMGIDCPVELKN